MNPLFAVVTPPFEVAIYESTENSSNYTIDIDDKQCGDTVQLWNITPTNLSILIESLSTWKLLNEIENKPKENNNVNTTELSAGD